MAKNNIKGMDSTMSVWGDPNLMSAAQSDSDELETIEEALMDAAWSMYELPLYNEEVCHA